MDEEDFDIKKHYTSNKECHLGYGDFEDSIDLWQNDYKELAEAIVAFELGIDQIETNPPIIYIRR